MADRVWSGQQQDAITAVLRWLADPNSPQVFRLFGFAGSGKTTLAKHLVQSVKGTVLFAAFTGKAALVLRKKGCHGASTLHSLIYRAWQDPKTGEYYFSLSPDSALKYAKLLVVDEVSMVYELLALDVLSFDTKVLVLGDPAQLPPVKGEGYFINAEPDVMLTEVHRQAQDNPIINMSMRVRQYQDLKEGQYGDSVVLTREDLTDDMLLGADQILCGMNKTRHRLNRKVREMRGLSGTKMAEHPAVGDRLVCLRNRHETGLLNGGLWEVLDVEAGRNVLSLQLDSLDEEGVRRIVRVPQEFFVGMEDTLDWRKRKDHDEFAFGWALTVHKFQGSQADNVLLYDESLAFRDNHAKWLYTGLTRAAEQITVVMP